MNIDVYQTHRAYIQSFIFINASFSVLAVFHCTLYLCAHDQTQTTRAVRTNRIRVSNHPPLSTAPCTRWNTRNSPLSAHSRLLVLFRAQIRADQSQAMRPSSCLLTPGCNGLKLFDAAAIARRRCRDTIEAATRDPHPIRRPPAMRAPRATSSHQARAPWCRRQRLAGCQNQPGGAYARPCLTLPPPVSYTHLTLPTKRIV